MTELEALTKRVSELESKLNSTKKEKPPRTPREPSEYNKFMGDYMSKNKSDKKSHKELFADAVKAWNLKKGK